MIQILLPDFFLLEHLGFTIIIGAHQYYSIGVLHLGLQAAPHDADEALGSALLPLRAGCYLALVSVLQRGTHVLHRLGQPRLLDSRLRVWHLIPSLSVHDIGNIRTTNTKPHSNFILCGNSPHVSLPNKCRIFSRYLHVRNRTSITCLLLLGSPSTVTWFIVAVIVRPTVNRCP